MELENGWIILGRIGEHEYVCEHFVCDSTALVLANLYRNITQFGYG